MKHFISYVWVVSIAGRFWRVRPKEVQSDDPELNSTVIRPDAGFVVNNGGSDEPSTPASMGGDPMASPGGDPMVGTMAGQPTGGVPTDIGGAPAPMGGDVGV